MRHICLFFLGICLPLFCTATLFQKIVVQDNDAVCLDGTLGVYYFSRGNSATKFMIYFEGGGWCGASTFDQTAQSCYQRSLMGLGSSKDYPPNYIFNDGILSDNSRNSFADFNKAYLKYCDGSGHQGTRSLPFSYRGVNLYFRGSNLTISKLQSIQNRYGLFSNSTEIMIVGGSAGGLAAFTWADYIRNRTSHSNVYSVPDSGVFLDSVDYQSHQSNYLNGFMNLFQFSNQEIDPPNPQCVQAYSSQPYKCMLAQYLHPYIQTPLFVIQSLYDSWSLFRIIGINCEKKLSLQNCSAQERAYIEEYHRNLSTVLERIGNKIGNGYWAPVCALHIFTSDETYNPDYAIPMWSNNTIDSALINWVLKRSGTHKHMDIGAWPDNAPCSVQKSINQKWLYANLFYFFCIVYLIMN